MNAEPVRPSLGRLPRFTSSVLPGSGCRPAAEATYRRQEVRTRRRSESFRVGTDGVTVGRQTPAQRPSS
jgi:hypothetical protein